MSNEDNKANIGDDWKAWSEFKANIGDSWGDAAEGYANEGDDWKLFWLGAPAVGDRGVIGGGIGFGSHNRITYISITTPGNSVYFGNLTVQRSKLAACSNGLTGRGVFAGGEYFGTNYDTIDYITILSTGNAIDFNDLTVARDQLAACSNGTNDRGVFAGGQITTANNVNTIDYITISTPAAAQDFGDMIGADERYGVQATSNGANGRGVIAGGAVDYDPPNGWVINNIDYITITSTGNSTDFGDLTANRAYAASASNGVNDRAVFAGGQTITLGPPTIFQTNIIDYVTISTTANAQDFGDLTGARYQMAACSNATGNICVFAGGYLGASEEKNIDYVNISSLGNASDFGDLLYDAAGAAGTSNG